jgi:hypothetical protein
MKNSEGLAQFRLLRLRLLTGLRGWVSCGRSFQVNSATAIWQTITYTREWREAEKFGSKEIDLAF